MYLPLYSHSTSDDAVDYELAPSKILGIGRNYRAHAKELGNDVPTEPLVFLIAPSALLAPAGEIVHPRGWDRVDYEGELGVIIGKRARGVTEDQAFDHILGYTCVNDVTVRGMQKQDRQWWRAKGMDTLCPVGPRIVRDLSPLDPMDLRVCTRVNGELRQDARTSLMIFSIPTLIATISRYMTLEVGDLISTGTPAGVGNLQPGDTVEVEIDGIGTLSNTVIAEP